MAEDTQLTWPIVGGEYPFEAGSGLFARVTKIEGDVVHYVQARKGEVIGEGHDCYLRTFRACFCPADQSSIPKLVEALEGLLKLIEDGHLIQDTSGDSESNWASSQLLFIGALAASANALAAADAALKGVR